MGSNNSVLKRLWCTTCCSILNIAVCTENSVDPDQTPRYAASYLGLHCLQSLLVPTLRGFTVINEAHRIAYCAAVMANVLRWIPLPYGERLYEQGSRAKKQTRNIFKKDKRRKRYWNMNIETTLWFNKKRRRPLKYKLYYEFKQNQGSFNSV